MIKFTRRVSRQCLVELNDGSAEVGEGKPIDALKHMYPGAIPNGELVTKVESVLNNYGFGKTTLLATSLSCDEESRDLETEFYKAYGRHFSMGGLAGFPFGGAAAFGNMAHHIPTDGQCLVVYGPHVGFDLEGNVGKINRRGQETSVACCESATAAADYVKKVAAGEIPKAGIPEDPFDAQQTWVGNLLLPHAERLANASVEAAELPLIMFDCQDEMMQKIVSAMAPEIHQREADKHYGCIALLGGIQISTPEGFSDYFLPKVFELVNNQGMQTDCLIAYLFD
jgi:hypothetical protein